MARAQRLRQHLPGLYRPEAAADGLLNQLVEALGLSMDQAQEQLSAVMQAHWYRYADKATFDQHALRDRERRGEPPYNVRDPADLLEIQQYPYINDLARHGKLLGVRPWLEPADQRDMVENYRRRIARILAVYRNGLGTIGALRAMVEAELPWALELSLSERVRSFAIEEGVSLQSASHPVQASGAPVDSVGALMRWRVQRNSTRATHPTLMIHGVAPVPDELAATDSPLVENYDPDRPGLIGIGVGYCGVVAEGETLRLAPARRSWIAGDNGLLASAVASDENLEAGPAANGPWTGAAGSPPIAVSCLLRTACGCLWLAGEEQLWRFDGDSFTRILESESFTAIHCLAEYRGRLYIGCDDGLFSTRLYPADNSYSRESVDELSGSAVHQFLIHQEQIWLATSAGPLTLQINPDASAVVGAPLFASPTYCLLLLAQTQYFGCEQGLLRHDVAAGRWHAWRGESAAEPQTTWQAIDPANLPDPAGMGLPPVRAIARTPDQSLWLGSEAGLARYHARHERDLLYRALLEAYPDLVDTAVNQLLTDDRGMLWIASDRGLLRFDGRDLAQYVAAEQRWVQRGRADSLYRNEIAAQARGRWRFNRTEGGWETFDSRAGRWANSDLELRTAEEAPVHRVLVGDSLIAHLGTWDGAQFEPQTAVPLAELRMRCKPDPQTIVDGGIPFIPALPGGASTWRYLQLEQAPVTPPEDLPFWSREGRLFPPPDLQDVWPGRYRLDPAAEDGRYDESVFAYLPSARITMRYTNPLALGVNVRLFRRGPGDSIDPAIVDRVFEGINKVRPAGVPVALSIEDRIVRGTDS